MKAVRPILAVFLSLVLAAGPVFSANPPVNDLPSALDKAKAENKLLFLQFGREACGNCQALKGMVKSGKVRLSPSKFVYADVNCDDPATRKAFGSKFKVRGSTLPFVVIAAPDGTQLAARSGYGSDADYHKLIAQAEKSLKPKSAAP